MPIQWVLTLPSLSKSLGHHKNQTENEYPPFGSKPVYLSRMNSSEKILKKKVI
jgi:hypothetical protein